MAEQSPEQLLSELAVLLKDVDWYLLGTHLHVPQDRLNAIQEEHANTARRLIQVLYYWLNDEEMSWEKIIEALKKIGGHGKVIGIIAKSKYKAPGQLKSQTSGSCTDRVAISPGIDSNGAPHRVEGNEWMVTECVEDMDKDQEPRNLKGTKEVEINGERHSLDVTPAASSIVVAKEKEKLLGAVDLKTLADDLGCAGAFIHIAYNGIVAAGPQYTELQIEIQDLGSYITILCSQSALTVSKFETASATVMTDLEMTFSLLLLNKEAIAIETLSSVSTLAGEMEKVALALQEKFQIEEEKVKKTLKKVQRARGEEAIRIIEKEKEHQQLKIQLQHKKLLDDAQRLEREAEAQRQHIEAKENDANSSIKHVGPLKSMVNAIFGYEVFDEGTKKLNRWKEKRIQALENERKLHKERYEAMNSFAIMIQNSQSEQEMAKVAEDALHETIGVLKQLIGVVKGAAIFWRQLQEHCKSLADDEMKAKVKRISESFTKEKRIQMWTSENFKKQAVQFNAGWVALNSLCAEYIERIKLTQKDLYKYIEENPTYEEARKNVHELAKKFLTDLKKRQEIMALEQD